MKKVVLSIAAMITLGFAANAQMSVIPKAGITLSRMAMAEEDDDDVKQKSNLGKTFGIGLNLPVSEGGVFSIQPELLYTQKGFKYAEGDYSYKEKINYLELPVLAKASFGGESVKAYVNAGPSVGFMIGAGYKAKFDSEEVSGKIIINKDEPANYNGDDSYTGKDAVNRLDLGMQVGGGIALQAGPGSLILDARYGLGLSNMAKTPEGESKSDYKSQNRVFAISLGYAIPFGK